MKLGQTGVLAGPVYKSRKGISRAGNGQDLPLSKVKAAGLGIVPKI